VREALFSILSPRIEGALFLDGYAGTGAVGIEALSRGARRCVFVESGRAAARTIGGNLASLGLEERARLLGEPFSRAIRTMGREDGPFDLVFLDPPYGPGEILRALRLSSMEGFLAPGGHLVAKHDARLEVPEQEGTLRLQRSARYGANRLSFYSHGQEAD
jgi:16S rRNA (guanine966-N2)-methyltransferase